MYLNVRKKMLWIRKKDQKQSIKEPINQSISQPMNRREIEDLALKPKLWSPSRRLDLKIFGKRVGLFKTFFIRSLKTNNKFKWLLEKYSVFSSFICSLAHQMKYFYCRKVLKVFSNRREKITGDCFLRRFHCVVGGLEPNSSGLFVHQQVSNFHSVFSCFTHPSFRWRLQFGA